MQVIDQDIEQKIKDFIIRHQILHGKLPDEISVTVAEYREISNNLYAKSHYSGTLNNKGNHCLMFSGIPIVIRPYSDLVQDWEKEAEQDMDLEEFDDSISNNK